MRFSMTFAALLVATAAAPTIAQARSGAPAQPDKSLSPYFIVKGAKPGTDTMPLKDTRADVSISGTIAHVRVTQVYKNDGDDTLEAIYVFPGSTRAAVFGMKMTVGDRTIVAEIQKKEEARKMYEAAKNAGKSASLLEQERPNVFSMNVANIMPGDTIKVEMDYTELLIPTDGTYEFVYPAVVGPRYTGEATDSDAKQNTWTATAHTEEGVKASYGWDMNVRVAAGLPIKRITSSSHPLSTEFASQQSTATVALANKGAAGTKDFVLQYQLAGKAIQSGLLLFEGAEENFFLAMVQPPKTVTKRAMPKREYIFILDVSGSMRGFPLDVAKKTLDKLLSGLRPADRFNIMFFSGGSKLLSEESLSATKANITKAHNMLANTHGGGGTRILNALEKALALPTPADYSRSFVVVTDGYVSVEPRVFEMIRENLGKANLFSFGIGSSVNRHIIDGMARVGMGEPFIVMHDDDASEKAAKFAKYIEAPALTNISVDFEGFDAYDVEPAAVPDLFASRPVVVFGKYKGKPAGSLTISGTTGQGAYKKSLSVGDYKPSDANQALRYLWARHRIAELADINRLRHDDARVKEVTDLGLKYNLMTAYTSFIAVDNRVRNKDGKSTTVKQPLPLPDGVENTAVSTPMGGSSYGMGMGLSGGGSGGGGMGVRGRSGTMKAYKVKRRPPRADKPTMPSPVTLGDLSPADDAEKESPKKATPLRVKIAQLIVTGARTSAQVKRAIAMMKTRLQHCVASKGGTTGTIAVQFVIGADGKVEGLKIVRNGTGSTAVQSCVARELKRLKLATMVEADAGDTKVTATFAFTR